MNGILKSLFDSDRADHAAECVFGTADYIEMRIRDSERRKTVRSLIRQSDVVEAIDLYHAAWILNHGDLPSDAELAYQLAEKSLHSGYEPAKWLFAAAFDRWCMYRGQPQRFGTQIVPDGIGYRVWDFDPETTDAHRERYNVPPIAEMHERASRDSAKLKQPPLEFAPEWLIDAIERWNRQSDA